MAGMGLGLAFGAQGAADQIRQILIDRALAKQQAFQNDLALRQETAREQQLQQAAQDRADRLAETAQHNRETAALRGVALRPAGGFVSPAEHDRETALGIPEALYSPQDATLGSTQMSGESTLPGSAPMRGQLRMMASPGKAAGYTFNQTQSEADKAAELKRKQDADAATADYRSGLLDLKGQLQDLKAAQGQPSHYQLAPEVDPKTGQQTGRMLGYNTKTNRFEPISGTVPIGTKAAPGAGQNAQHEQAKQEALGSLDQLDQAIDAAKDLVGPAAGRYSSIQQMVGSADPKIQALGTKMILAKMQVDHAATGTVRAAASPQLLQRWDNILANQVTPEGLKAAVQAMREILSGNGSVAGGGEAGVIYARDEKGQLHQAKAGTPLPAGWTLEKR